MKESGCKPSVEQQLREFYSPMLRIEKQETHTEIFWERNFLESDQMWDEEKKEQN
jgi:hypothetical protein